VVRTLSIAGLGAGITAAGASGAFATGYKVKAGDTLSEIAQAHGTNWHQLAEINNLSNPDLILIGQSLQLDGARKSAATQKRTRTTHHSTARRTERKVHPKVHKKVHTSRSETKRFSGNSSTRRSSARSGKVRLSGGWAAVAKCESGGNPRAVNPAGYYGLFQFDRQTWRSVGGSGSPASASASEQLMRAKKLYSQRGASPWPVCGRHLR